MLNKYQSDVSLIESATEGLKSRAPLLVEMPSTVAVMATPARRSRRLSHMTPEYTGQELAVSARKTTTRKRKPLVNVAEPPSSWRVEKKQKADDEPVSAKDKEEGFDLSLGLVVACLVAFVAALVVLVAAPVEDYEPVLLPAGAEIFNATAAQPLLDTILKEAELARVHLQGALLA